MCSMLWTFVSVAQHPVSAGCFAFYKVIKGQLYFIQIQMIFTHISIHGKLILRN